MPGFPYTRNYDDPFAKVLATLYDIRSSAIYKNVNYVKKLYLIGNFMTFFKLNESKGSDEKS
jgi:hypothetical protein